MPEKKKTEKRKQKTETGLFEQHPANAFQRKLVRHGVKVAVVRPHGAVEDHALLFQETVAELSDLVEVVDGALDRRQNVVAEVRIGLLHANDRRHGPTCGNVQKLAEAFDPAHAQNLHGVVDGRVLVEVGVAFAEGFAKLVLRQLLQNEQHQQILVVAQIADLAAEVHDGVLREFGKAAVGRNEVVPQVRGAEHFHLHEHVEKADDGAEVRHAAAPNVADVAGHVAAREAHQLVVVRVVDRPLFDLARLVAERRAAHAGPVRKGVRAVHLVAPAVFKNPLAARGARPRFLLDHFGGKAVGLHASVRGCTCGGFRKDDEAFAARVVAAKAALVARGKKAVAPLVGAPHRKLFFDVGYDAGTLRHEVVAETHGHVLPADAVLVGALRVAQPVDLAREFLDLRLVLGVLLAELRPLLLGFGEGDGHGKPFERELQQRFAVVAKVSIFDPVHVEVLHKEIFFQLDGAVHAPRKLVLRHEELAHARLAGLEAATMERYKFVGRSVERGHAYLAVGHFSFWSAKRKKEKKGSVLCAFA